MLQTVSIYVQSIGLVLIGILLTILVANLRKIWINKAKAKITGTSPAPVFDPKKFWHGLLSLTDKELWGKLTTVFNIRVLSIVLLVIGVVSTVSYYRGKLNKKVEIIAVKYEEEAHIGPFNPPAITVDKEANTYEWSYTDVKGKVHPVCVKDVQSMTNELRPYGFIFKPYFSYGGAAYEDKFKNDIGAGVDLIKVQRWRAGPKVSNNGATATVGFMCTSNFGIHAGWGKTWKMKDLITFGGRWDFN